MLRACYGAFVQLSGKVWLINLLLFNKNRSILIMVDWSRASEKQFRFLTKRLNISNEQQQHSLKGFIH